MSEVRPDRTKSADRLRSLQYPLRELGLPVLRRVSSQGSPYLGISFYKGRSWRVYYRKATKSYLLHAEDHSASTKEYKGGFIHVAD